MLVPRWLHDSIRKRWIRERFDAWEKGKAVPSRHSRRPRPLKRLTPAARPKRFVDPTHVLWALAVVLALIFLLSQVG